MYIVYQYHKYFFFKLIILCEIGLHVCYIVCSSSFWHLFYTTKMDVGQIFFFYVKPCNWFWAKHVWNTFFFFLQQQQTSFEDRFVTSILLEPRSLVFVCDDMYKTYLHGISERTVDKISNSIANIEMCEMAQSAEDLTRTTRVSLTIRHVPKVLKAKFLFGKKWFCSICTKTFKITFLDKFIFLHQERYSGCLSLL